MSKWLPDDARWAQDAAESAHKEYKAQGAKIAAAVIGHECVINWGRYRGRRAVIVDASYSTVYGDLGRSVRLKIKIFKQNGEGYLNLTSKTQWNNQFIALSGVELHNPLA